MPLETPSQAVGPINPGSLIGTASPVVEPRSTQALVEAYHQGIISADDIHQRIGQLGQLKEKAQITGLQEQLSPEAQAARAGALQLASAQQNAALPNVGPAGQLQGQQIEAQQNLLKYPATAYFDKFAPTLGIQTPMTPDGQIDYAKKEAIGAKLAVWNSERAEAHDKLQNITTKDSADGTVLFAVSKQGEPISPEEVARLRAKATKSFSMSDLTPGAVVEPSAAPAVEKPVIEISPETASHVRADLVNQGVAGAAQMTDAQIAQQVATAPAPVVAPAAPVKPVVSVSPAAPQVGASIPGVGVSLGAKTPDRSHFPPMTGEQQKGLAQAAFTDAQIKELANSFKTFSKEEPWLTGPVMGRLAAIAHPENWNKAAADFERAKTAILANLAKGVYHETGVLSDRDISRYEKTLPSSKDTAEVAQSKIDSTQRDIFSSIATNIETMRAQNQAITPLLASMEQSAKDALTGLQTGGTSAAPKAAGGVLTLPTGRKIQRDANGNYFEVK